jgi:5-oxoprolinase (ATP-hydrolysing)
MNDWNIWINRGKEITEGMAINTDGELSRIKVLSTGRLRGRIKRQIATNLFETEQNWGINDDIFSDYYFSLLDRPSPTLRVVTFDTTNSTLELTAGDSQIQAGNEFEIFTNEESEVLVTRILTKTLLNNEFPSLKMQPQFIKNVNSLYPLLITSSGIFNSTCVNKQNSDKLFILNMRKIHSLFDIVIEVEEEIDGDGNVLTELKENKINDLLRGVFKFRPELVIIALMNASRNPLHEKTIFNLLKAAGNKNVFASHQLIQQC